MLILYAPSRAEENDRRVQRILTDWRNRQQQIDGVRYRVVGETTISKGSWPRYPSGYDDAVPPQDVRFPETRTILFDFAFSRYRFDEQEEMYHKETQKRYPQVTTRIFDGRSLTLYRPRDLNTHPEEGVGPTDPELGIGKGTKEFPGAPIQFRHWPILVAHGCIPSYRHQVIPGKTFRVLPAVDALHVHGQTVHKGRPCLVLRNEPANGCFDEWWVDTGRESAVVRQTVYLKRPYLECVIEYQQKVGGWYPSEWTFTTQDGYTGRTLRVNRMRVESIEVNPAITDADFEIGPKPGALVAHVAHRPSTQENPYPEPESTKLYRIDEHGRSREVTFEGGIERPVARAVLWKWLVGSVIVAFAVWATLVILWRYRRSRMAPRVP